MDILKKTRVVLKTYACGYAIDTEVFGHFCLELARALVDPSKYKFWFMPSAVHKALIHGAAIIQALPVPIGMVSGTCNFYTHKKRNLTIQIMFWISLPIKIIFSEEPIESSHKIVRYVRLHHTRKISRLATMTDLFRGVLIQTDPVIASLRHPPKPKGMLDRTVASMLIGGNEGVPLQELMEEYDSDIDDPE